MERSTVVKTISTQSMFGIIEPTPPPYISFPQKPNSRDVSFSSYLNQTSEDPDMSSNNKNRADIDTEISIFDAEKYFNESGSSEYPKLMSKRVSPVNLDRISERCEYLSSIPRLSSASSSVDGYGRNYRARSFHATPTASSEASWNSQTGLLSNPPGALAVSMQNPSPPGDEKRRGSTSKWILGRRCPCSGKKSVEVQDKVRTSSEPRTPCRVVSHSSRDPKKLSTSTSSTSYSIESSLEKSSVTSEWLERQEVAIPKPHRGSLTTHHQQHRVMASSPRPFNEGNNGFSFPILNHSTAPPFLISKQTTPSVKTRVLNGLPPTKYTHPPPEEPPRDSLEVFRPPNEDPVTSKVDQVVQRRQSFTFPGSPPKSRMTTALDDDMASDASSDLFEIESFTTQTSTYQSMYNNNNNNLNRRDSLEDDAASFNARRLEVGGNGGLGIYRQSVDEACSIAATEGYEPSEASIEWSVVTAEAYDRASSVTNLSVAASEISSTRHLYEESGKSSSSGGGDGGKRRSSGGLLSCRCEKAVSVGPRAVRCVGGDEGQRGGSSISRHVSSRTFVNNNNNKPPLPLARSHSARFSLPVAPFTT